MQRTSCFGLIRMFATDTIYAIYTCIPQYLRSAKSANFTPNVNLVRIARTTLAVNHERIDAQIRT